MKITITQWVAEGRTAFHAGVGFESCQYAVGTVARNDWELGFLDAQLGFDRT